MKEEFNDGRDAYRFVPDKKEKEKEKGILSFFLSLFSLK